MTLRPEGDEKTGNEDPAQAQVIAAARRLTGGVAHDFNNILTILNGNVQMLKEYASHIPQTEAYIAACDRAIRRGAELAQRLLSFSRAPILSPQKIDVHALIAEKTALLRPVLGAHIEVKLTAAGDAVLIHADPEHLGGALLNLALNAGDAMPGGGIITIGVGNVMLDEFFVVRHPGLKPGGHALITVSDTGHGIPAEILGRIFEPFFTTKDTGHGLGLSMVYDFIGRSGGAITVASTPGQGTEIALYFPVCA
jgi:signal transduction histidine kinase